MKNNIGLLTRIKNILREVRFGNLSSRLPQDVSSDDKEFVSDFNSMLEALQDRERMLSENQGIFLAKNEYLKTLFNMLNEGIIALSGDYKILSINKTQADWFRVSHNKLFGMNLFDVLKKYTIYDANGQIISNFDKFFAGSDKKNYILTFEIKKIRMTFSVTVKKFFDKDKNVNYFVISKDISSETRLQKLRDNFIATLTHDLKVPIVAEEKILKLLINKNLGEISDAQNEAISNMIANNKDMLGLVNTLLDVYKLEDGVFKITKSRVSIEDLVSDEVEKIKYLATEAGVKIKVKNKLKVSQIFVDETQIGRVVMNLLTNAINFAPQNSDVLVEMYNEDKKIYISVSDSGSGILPENISKVFDRYYTKKYRKVGTGLGLFLSKNIAKLHDGDITVESIPNKKTTFTLALPVENS